MSTFGSNNYIKYDKILNTERNEYEHLNTNLFFTAGDEKQFFSKISLSPNELRFQQTHNKRNESKERRNKIIEIFDKYKINFQSTCNTFNYMFQKYKKGIYIRIKNNKVDLFLPFNNQNYENEWSTNIENIHDQEYIRKVLTYADILYNNSRSDLNSLNNLHLDFYNNTIQCIKNIEQKNYVNPRKWYANNFIFRFDKSPDSNVNMISLYEMFVNLCSNRKIPDVEFFINRRDYPIMNKNGTEAYSELFAPNTNCISHCYTSYCPILSVCATENNADILIPTFEDWIRIASTKYKILYPPEFKNYDYVFNEDWDSKLNVAVFRGTNTGMGYDEITNKRIKLAKISKQYPEIIDAGFVRYNLRPRIINRKIYFTNPESLTELKEYLPPNIQSNYKYIINVEGHVSAFRLSLEMNMNSCILLVKSKYKMWYSDLLKEYEHYIPVEEDLSDLVEKIQWCQQNDKIVKEIAKNAKEFYNKYLQEDGILDYLEELLCKLNLKCV